jgi:23S rRNA (adenine-N6)-dimethyltransferase
VKDSIKYSQNFLKSSNLVKSLIEKSSIKPDDIVYEIGAGLGAITTELAAHCKEVVAVEADNRLYEALKQRFRDVPNIKLVNGDFLVQPLPNEPYKVFSNIPFNITAAIIHKLVEAVNPPKDSYLFVQKEAAKKFVGKPYGSQETQLSLLIKPSFQLEVVHQFQSSDFQPVPAIDVVLLRIRQLDKPLVDEANIKDYQDFIVYAFNATKPNLKKGLDKIFTHDQFKRLSRDLSFSLLAKPSELDFNQWLGLFSYYNAGVIDEKKQLVRGATSRLKSQQVKLDKVHRTSIAKDWLGV